MGFEIVSYGKLRKSIDDAVKLLLAHHNVKSVAELSDHRRFQVELLNKTIELLSSQHKGPEINQEMQSRLLNAMTFYVRELIRSEYGTSSPENSFLFVQLGYVLRLTDPKKGDIEANQPTLEDKRIMINELKAFILKKTYQEGNPDKNYLHADSQPYLAVKNFNAFKFVMNLSNYAHILEVDSFKSCEKRKEAQLNEGKSTGYSSYLPSLGTMFGGSKKPDNDFGFGLDPDFTL